MIAPDDPYLGNLLAHYVRLAQEPGWWAYVERQVRRMDRGPSGLFRGIEETWRAQLAAIAFQPHESELGQWWVLKSEAEREAEAAWSRT